MTDLIDKANNQAQVLLDSQIRQMTPTQAPNNVDACVDCDEPIGKQRKKVLPHAIRCIGCQWTYERTHEKGVKR